MSYDPYAPTEKERSYAFFVAWIGLVISLLVLATRFFPIWTSVQLLLMLALGCLLVVFTMTRRMDDYFNALRNVGLGWGLSVVGLWLAASGLVAVFNLSHHGGFMLASDGRLPRQDYGLPPLLHDAQLLAILASIGFFSGFLFARLRDR